MLGNKCSTSLVSTPGRMFLFPGVYTRFAGVMFLPWLKVRVTATHALLSHVASQQKPPNYLDPASYAYQTFTTSNLVHTKVPQKTSTFERRAKRAQKNAPPLSRAKREKFPSLHTPYWSTQKCHRKPALLIVSSFPLYIPR